MTVARKSLQELQTTRIREKSVLPFSKDEVQERLVMAAKKSALMDQAKEIQIELQDFSDKTRGRIEYVVDQLSRMFDPEGKTLLEYWSIDWDEDIIDTQDEGTYSCSYEMPISILYSDDFIKEEQDLHAAAIKTAAEKKVSKLKTQIDSLPDSVRQELVKSLGKSEAA